MARLNEILVGRFNRSYQKLFGLKGGPPVATLAPEIMPSHVVFSGREERYAQGWNTFGLFTPVGAVAAQNSGVALSNPAGSNVVATVELLSAWETVADTAQPALALYFGPASVNLGGPLTPQRLDFRTQSAKSALSPTRGNNTGVFGQIVQSIPVPVVNTLVQFIGTDIQEISLLPGDSMGLLTSVVNTTLMVSMLWRERYLEESERT